MLCVSALTSHKIGSWASRLHLKLGKKRQHENGAAQSRRYLSSYQKECPQEQVTGEWSVLVVRTALGHPGEGHHLRCGWSWTKLFVISNWYFCFTSVSHSSSL